MKYTKHTGNVSAKGYYLNLGGNKIKKVAIEDIEDSENIYTADDGKTFIRKSDSFVMGHIIDLGSEDSMDNYEEVELTEANDIEGLLKNKKYLL